MRYFKSRWNPRSALGGTHAGADDSANHNADKSTDHDSGQSSFHPVPITDRGGWTSNPSPTATIGHRLEIPSFLRVLHGTDAGGAERNQGERELSRNGKFTFTGTNQGRINTVPAVYVWGIDRNGNLPSGPFTNRPNIKFDAVVIVTLGPPRHLTAEVVDLAHGNSTNLPSGSARIKGSTVSVTVPSSLLPSTGLPTSQYHFNYWPEDGGPPVSSSVASFAPEFTTAQVGTMG